MSLVDFKTDSNGSRFVIRIDALRKWGGDKRVGFGAIAYSTPMGSTYGSPFSSQNYGVELTFLFWVVDVFYDRLSK